MFNTDTMILLLKMFLFRVRILL